MSHSLPPLALYIHVPWCVRKCPYCDFNSHGVGSGASLPEEAYLAALIADLDADLPLAAGRELVSIFIGGGTPSLMSADFYGRLLGAISARLPFADDIEITLEANPGTVERGRFAGYRAAGINRLSIGVQSFQDAQLSELGRIHSGDEARLAVAEARQAGFDNLNLDLMHGLPGQTPALALDDLDQALALSPSICPGTSSPSSPTPSFTRARPCCPRRRPSGTSRSSATSGWRPPASRATRFPPMPGQAAPRATISTTGDSVTIWASGPAPMASSALTMITAFMSSAAGRPASPRPTCAGMMTRAASWPAASRSRPRSCRSSSP